MGIELKPCPFCGSKAKYTYSMPYNAVQCTKCKVFGKTIIDSYEQQDGKAEAIEAWNKRVQQAVVNQYGENCTNITNSGTLNFSL